MKRRIALDSHHLIRIIDRQMISHFKMCLHRSNLKLEINQGNLPGLSLYEINRLLGVNEITNDKQNKMKRASTMPIGDSLWSLIFASSALANDEVDYIFISGDTGDYSFNEDQKVIKIEPERFCDILHNDPLCTIQNVAKEIKVMAANE